ncbi:hypothetical protein GCM10027418_08900 [Mariniluteicoccus endophyticus]
MRAIPTSRTARIVAGAGTLAVVAAAAVALPASAAGEDYVALGDSYAAGVGAGNYIKDGTDCMRSPGSYGGVLAAQRGYNLNLQACSGAVTSDMSMQVKALSASTRRVSISIGGNDAGFAPVVTECLKPGWWGDCDGALSGANAKMTNELPSRLRTVYADVKARAPQAKVVVTGYPRLFNGQDCSIVTFFTADEMWKLNRMADQLNGVIRTEAERAGFQFVDPTQTFSGHAVCDNPEWIHNASIEIKQSFHPKADGHRAYAGLIGGRLDTAPRIFGGRSAKQVRTGGQTSSDTGRGTPVIPDYDSAEARSAARRAGISEAEVTTLSNATKKVKQARIDKLTGPERAALARAKHRA